MSVRLSLSVLASAASVLIPAQAYAAGGVSADACGATGGTVITVVAPVYRGPKAHRGKYLCKGGKYNGDEAFIVHPK